MHVVDKKWYVYFFMHIIYTKCMLSCMHVIDRKVYAKLYACHW